MITFNFLNCCPSYPYQPHIITMPDGAPHCDLFIFPKDYIISNETMFRFVLGRYGLNIVAKITDFDEFGRLICVLDALNRLGIKNLTYELMICYIPTRQDREQPGFAFTTEIYAKILKEFSKAKRHHFYLPHGKSKDVFQTYLPNSTFLDGTSFFLEAVDLFKPDAIIIPDDGAKEAILSPLLIQRPYINYVRCTKIRDSKTGKLSAPNIIGDVKNKRLLILDDICDGGGTFLQLADELGIKGATQLGLAVYHGIFSKGYRELNKRFANIYTTNSFHEEPDFCIEVADDSRKVTMLNWL